MYSEVDSKEKKSSHEVSFFHRRTKRLLSPAGNGFEKFLNVFAIYSLCFIVFGIISAIGSSLSLSFLKNLFGILLLGYSGIHFYFFKNKVQLSLYKLSIFFGFFGFALGLSCFIITSINYMQVLVVFGLYLLLVTLERMFQGFSLIRLRDKKVIVFLVHSFLLVFMAILLFLNPFLNLYFGEILGAFSILFGILNLSSLSFMRKKEDGILSFFD